MGKRQTAMEKAGFDLMKSPEELREIIGSRLGKMNYIPDPKTRKNQKRALTDPQLVARIVDTYFEYCRDVGRVPSVAGMANVLGVTKATISNYQNGKYGEEWTEVFDAAKGVLEDWVVQKLFDRKSVTGAIFYLKQIGWKDVKPQAPEDGQGNDNRSVTQIIINSEEGQKKLDVKSGKVK